MRPETKIRKFRLEPKYEHKRSEGTASGRRLERRMARLRDAA